MTSVVYLNSSDYKKYANLHLMLTRYRKHTNVDDRLDEKSFNKEYVKQYIEINSKYDGKRYKTILFKKDCKFVKSVGDFKVLMKSIKNVDVLLAVTSRPFSIHINNVLSSYPFRIDNYAHLHFVAELPTMPMCAVHVVLSPEEQSRVEKETLLTSADKLPKIYTTDPQLCWTECKAGQIVEIKSTSRATCNSIKYRYIIPGEQKMASVKSPSDQSRPSTSAPSKASAAKATGKKAAAKSKRGSDNDNMSDDDGASERKGRGKRKTKDADGESDGEDDDDDGVNEDLIDGEDLANDAAEAATEEDASDGDADDGDLEDDLEEESDDSGDEAEGGDDVHSDDVHSNDGNSDDGDVHSENDDEDNDNAERDTSDLDSVYSSDSSDASDENDESDESDQNDESDSSPTTHGSDSGDDSPTTQDNSEEESEVGSKKINRTIDY